MYIQIYKSAYFFLLCLYIERYTHIYIYMYTIYCSSVTSHFCLSQIVRI